MYEWVLALHVMAWASWMAGLFYLPRLFVYHAERAEAGSESSETFKVMEWKLYRFIMRPAMIATWITGLYLAFVIGIIDWSYDIWMHVKLLLVILMTGAHHVMGKWIRDFDADANARTGRFYRFANEAPTLLFIGIVVMVYVRPL